MDKKRILVFAPHPDDETLGCGGTIARRISEGYTVEIVVMTDGRHAFLHVLGIDSDPTPNELKELRKEEVKRATRILGVSEKDLIFLDFEDGTLGNNEENAKEKVARILFESRPVEVYLPHKKDGHPDHQATYQIVTSSIKKLGISTQIYQYSITEKHMHISPLINTFLDYKKQHVVRVDISKFLHLKESAVNEFKTELTAISDRQHNPVVRGISKFLKNEETFQID